MEKLTKEQKKIADLKKVIFAKETAVKLLKAMVRERDERIIKLRQEIYELKEAELYDAYEMTNGTPPQEELDELCAEFPDLFVQ